MPNRGDKFDWLRKQISFLADLGMEFNDGGPTIEYGPYTLLKLICVAYYAPMFAKIAGGPKAKAQGYDGVVYLDFFAGPDSENKLNERLGGGFADSCYKEFEI